MREFLEAGLHPTEIVYTSFTRAAAREAARRARATFTQFGEDDFPYFATTHSIAFRGLGLMGHAFTDKHLKAFGDEHGYQFSCMQGSMETALPEAMLSEAGDYLEFFDSWRKNCLLYDLDEAYKRFTLANSASLPSWWGKGVVEVYIEAKNEYKRREGLWDFSDMLLGVLEREFIPLGMRVFLGDEIQDNSPLLQKVHELWAGAADEAYMVGDPNQSIYTFAGADPSLFIDMKCDATENLRQSWRCAVAVRGLARKVIVRNKVRLADDDFLPTKNQGEVLAMPVDLVPWEELASDGRTAFYLLRTRWLVSLAYEQLICAGVPFTTLRGKDSPLQGDLSAVALTMLRLVGTDYVALPALAKLASHIPTKPYLKHGAKAELNRRAKEEPNTEVNFKGLPGLGFSGHFFECLNESDFAVPLKAEPAEKAYLHRIYQHYGVKAFQKPSIVLSTQHGVKGMEADVVVISPQYTRLPWESMDSVDGVEAENRLAYTSITRARDKIIILEPEGRYFYPYP